MAGHSISTTCYQQYGQKWPFLDQKEPQFYAYYADNLLDLSNSAQNEDNFDEKVHKIDDFEAKFGNFDDFVHKYEEVTQILSFQSQNHHKKRIFRPKNGQNVQETPLWEQIRGKNFLIIEYVDERHTFAHENTPVEWKYTTNIVDNYYFSTQNAQNGQNSSNFAQNFEENRTFHFNLSQKMPNFLKRAQSDALDVFLHQFFTNSL